MAEEFETYNSVTLTDENGNDIQFNPHNLWSCNDDDESIRQLADAIEHGGRKYCILFPADMSADERADNDPVILEYIEDADGDYLEELADDDEYDELYGIYLGE